MAITKWKRNIQWSLLVPHSITALIMSNIIVSPLDFLQHSKRPIQSPEILVLALAIRDANMTTPSDCEDCIVCSNDFSLESAMNDGATSLFFGFNFENRLFSFVTCAGQLDEIYSFWVLFALFHWTLWISIISCVFLLLIMLALCRHWDYNWMTDSSSISLVLGSLGCEIIIRNIVKGKRLVYFIILWSLIGILIGNLYQARLTESLILPRKYIQNQTLVELIDQNFTILMTTDIGADQGSQLGRSHGNCFGTQFCRPLVLEHVMDRGNLQYLMDHVSCLRIIR